MARRLVNRLRPVVFAAAALAYGTTVACAGKSVRHDDGESGDAGEPSSGGGASGAQGGGAVGTGGSRNSGGTSGSTTGGVSGASSGGTTGSAGASGTGTCLVPCTPTECSAVTPPTSTIHDFDDLYFEGTPPVGIYGILDEQGTLKPEWWLGYFSGSYSFPAIPDPCTGEPPPPYPLARDESSGELRITGTVGAPSGFGIWFGPCLVDLSRSSGISFRIGGDAGPGMLELKAFTSPNLDPDRCWRGRGTCTTDVCAPASVTIAVPATPAVLSVLWTSFAGGLPASGVDASQVAYFSWDFVWSNSMLPYEVDVTLDDVVLLE